MFKHSKLISFFFLTFVVLIALTTKKADAQSSWASDIQWKNLLDGLDYTELTTPEKSVVNDSKLSILRIDISKFEFRFLTASEHGRKMRTAPEWANEFDMNLVVNAGMYAYNKTHSNKGYMKNFNHLNNPHKSDYYNAMMAMHPKESGKQAFEIFDITYHRWDSIQPLYHSFCQGMRMISSRREAMEFSKRPDQSCSMIVAATDEAGLLYIVFTRSPYTHRTIIGYLLDLPLNLRTSVYLEGGPEASLYIQTSDTIIAKYGSYVSNTCNNDNNDHFWKIPNVIALRVKK